MYKASFLANLRFTSALAETFSPRTRTRSYNAQNASGLGGAAAWCWHMPSGKTSE